MRPSAIFISVLLMIPVGFRSTTVPESAGQTRDAARQAPLGSGYKISVDVNTVFLNVSVRDRYNRSIAHLQKEDFQVYENGVPQEVQQLVSEEAPFNTLLLLDNSGSTQPYLGLIKNAAIDFTRRMKSTDQISVAAFNSLVDLMQDFTDDRQELQRAIEKIDSIGGTALYDSLLICINRYIRGISGRGAIVVFTDGFDNHGPDYRSVHRALPHRVPDLREMTRFVQIIGCPVQLEEQVVPSYPCAFVCE
jgi:VWFA-related protein